MGRQKLSTKILIATMISFVLVYLAVITVTPYFVYHLVRESEAKEALAFNEQVGMRIEQRFDELTRFSSVVAMDETLNREIADCMKSPSPGAEAALRLRISGMIQKDGVSSYHVLGIYIETENEDGSIFRTETVGFPENVKRYLQNTLIPSYLEAGKETAYILPFGYSDEDTQSYFGSGFTQVYGFIRPYGRDGRIAIISSYDEISLIAGALEDNYTDFLLCAGGRPIPPFSETGRINPDELEGRMAIGNSYQESSLITKDGIYAARDLGSSGWSMITWLDRAEVLRRNRNQTWMIFLTVGIFSLILGGVIFIIVTRFTRPLMEVSERMRQIAGGDFSARVEVHSEDEIGQVSRAFNAMARQLEEKIEAIVEKEKQEQSMKYSLLISQVDPHFLYNTMNMITYLAQKGRNEDIVVVNRAMIEILKDRLRIEISQVYDTVEQEISVIRQYLIIQEYRYEGMFRVRYDIDENAKGLLILKNVIQPLVENALSHGILENRDENGEPLGGCIVISVKTDEPGFIGLTVSDNGAGMPEEDLEKVMDTDTVWERGKHIGIRNVRQRLQYIYQSDVDFRIESRLGEGTTVSMRLPVVKPDENGGDSGIVTPIA